MESMIVGTSTFEAGSSEITSASLENSSTAPTATPSGPQPHQTSTSSYLPTSSAFDNRALTNAPVGQIVFQDGYSAYFNSEFWPAFLTEVEDLRSLFDDPGCGNEYNDSSRWTSMSVLGMPYQFSATEFGLAHPTLYESNMLCKYFFESVNPFIRAIHSSLFARELSMYRRGTFHLPREFEALLFAIYTLTVNSLRPEIVQGIFSTSKDEALSRLQMSTQVALTRINFYKTEKIHGLGALLHYLTFIFQQNLYKDGIPLLAVAVRIAQNMGIHRDSRHFPYSPWVTEIRARIWNHICNLDAQATSVFGAESCLPPTSDALPPKNADDREWHASRFANPSSVPANVLGFKDTTFALVHREISDTIRRLAAIDGNNFDERQRIISECETVISKKYLAGIDRTNPSQTVITAFVEVRISTLRLSLRHRQIEKLKANPSDPYRQQVFLSAIQLLEAIMYHITTFSVMNWEFIFSTSVPWLASAIALIDSRHATRQSDKDRAQREVEAVFKRFKDSPVATTKMWKILEQLRMNMMDETSQGLANGSGREAKTSDLGGSSMPGDAGGAAVSQIEFSDDMMFEFGGVEGDRGPGTYDEMAMIGDLQDLPWYAWAGGGSNTQ
ncbi:uncharacterized protein RSE6_05156 [Rhynchosporium secalis]|uniref:Xylanolytic transcriptional activator regulatory domain-containing protein n=1 Tax=Rhynchosporium secalis TaxID=38038 RepID=A0A1E1M728_RHYSE|nr:uncharacterized protein RSE6_05156 [Rhynchosporium secalis]